VAEEGINCNVAADSCLVAVSTPLMTATRPLAPGVRVRSVTFAFGCACLHKG
jgi:hypothetical protein